MRVYRSLRPGWRVETATPLKLMMPYDSAGTSDLAATEIAWHLNSRMQSILLGIPGGPDKAPC